MRTDAPDGPQPQAPTINSHVAYYLSSKIIAAIIGVGTMAVFLRLGGIETYGVYVVVVAWAYVIYGCTLQWLRFSFFACYGGDGRATLVPTYLGVLLAGFALIAVAAWLCAATGAVPGDIATAVVVLFVGIAAYDALHEIARTRLQAGAVASGVVVRAVLMLVLGTVALVAYGTPMALATAVSAAHIGAAVCLSWSLVGIVRCAWSARDAQKLWAYGRLLVPAYGLDAVGLQLDRLLLARYAPLGDIGSYGAVADLIRQIMIVVSEAISGAYIAIARAHAVAGRQAEAVDVLGRAFLAYTALAAFGAAFIMRFDGLAFKILFGSALSQAVEPAIPLIVASTVFAVFRGYYFGQVLHLLNNSRLLLISNGVHAALVACSGIALVPVYGMWGAAAALLLGHVGGCIAYVWAWRNSYVMRLPYADGLAIIAMALAAYAVSGMLEHHLGHGLDVAGLNAVILLGAAGATAYRFNVLSFNDLVARIRRGMVLKAKRVGP